MHIKNDWTGAEIQALYQKPFLDLVFQAQQIHRQYFEANTIQVSTLLSIKTGKCPEDCKYCFTVCDVMTSKLEAEKRIAVEKVFSEAQQAKASGCTRVVWAQHGEIHMNVICLMSWIWSVKSKLWVNLYDARHAECLSSQTFNRCTTPLLQP